MYSKTFNLFIILWLYLLSCQSVSAQTIEEKWPWLNELSIIYSGPPLGIEADSLLKLGFTHIDVLSVNFPEKIPPSRKYILWTGIAYTIRNSPWATLRSPYGNNLQSYQIAWQKRLEAYNVRYSKASAGTREGIIVLDIEAKKSKRQLMTNDFQLAVKEDGNEHYKENMAWLYYQPLSFLRTHYNHYELVSSYGDVPIERVWWEISQKPWSDWISNTENLNYVTHQFEAGKPSETNFSKNLDFYAVSSYFFYDYNIHGPQLAGRYLAYMLFMLEANKAWAKKDVILYHTFRFQGVKERNSFISKSMVRNMVVFSIMAGADGLILHDDFKRVAAPDQFNELFETFCLALAQMKRYHKYLKGNAEYFKPDNPRDLFESRNPVVRGIENNGYLLIAAADPFMAPNEKKVIRVNYKNNAFEIELAGNDPAIKEFKLTD
jgi:hypothetical protein